MDYRICECRHCSCKRQDVQEFEEVVAEDAHEKLAVTDAKLGGIIQAAKHDA